MLLPTIAFLMHHAVIIGYPLGLAHVQETVPWVSGPHLHA